VSLQGKVAVVTGASRGIGRAIAVALAARGARVVMNYLHNEEAAAEAAAAVGARAFSYVSMWPTPRRSTRRSDRSSRTRVGFTSW